MVTAAKSDRSLIGLIAGFAILAAAVLVTVVLSAAQPRTFTWSSERPR